MATNSRQRILAATEELLRTRGVARLTTKDIARAAGLAEGTLFNHFARKDDLVLAVILERAPKFLLDIPEAGKKTVLRNLADIARGVMGFYDDVLPVILSVFADAELVGRHRDAVRLRKGGPQHMIRAIAHYIEGEQTLGRINPAIHSSHAAFGLIAPCFQWVFAANSSGMPIFPDMTRDDFAKHLAASQLVSMALPGEAAKTGSGTRSPRPKVAARKPATKKTAAKKTATARTPRKTPTNTR